MDVRVEQRWRVRDGVADLFPDDANLGRSPEVPGCAESVRESDEWVWGRLPVEDGKEDQVDPDMAYQSSPRDDSARDSSRPHSRSGSSEVAKKSELAMVKAAVLLLLSRLYPTALVSSASESRELRHKHFLMAFLE